MKPINKAVTKQLIKYFLIIIVALTGLFLGKIIWNLPKNMIYLGFGIGVVILIIALVFDALSVKDIIPILKK